MQSRGRVDLLASTSCKRLLHLESTLTSDVKSTEKGRELIENPATPVTQAPLIQTSVSVNLMPDALDGRSESAECVICLKTFEVGDERGEKLLPCAHVDYHDFCIRAWFNVSPSCPVCKVLVDHETVVGVSVYSAPSKQKSRRKRQRVEQNESANMELALEQSYNEYFGRTKPFI